ncbi:MAG: hypothetical protein JOZ19_15480 [Rubrobacter sp.]|nr:hypothetical protein [Rubrobacter sp.]
MWAGIVLIALVGLIHLFLASEYFEYASYLGLLFVANVVGAIASAVGIYRGSSWGWILGVFVAGGAFGMYVISRAFGLPGLPQSEREWFDPPGVFSLIVEALFVVLYIWRATQATADRR